MLRRNRQRALVDDPALGDAGAERIRGLVEESRIDEAHALMDGTTDPQEREHLVHAVAAYAGRRDWFDTWVSRYGESSSIPWLVRGAHRIHRAWHLVEVMTGNATDDQWLLGFYRRMQDAEADLNRAIDLDPTDPLPWGQLCMSARGLKVPASRLCSRFEQVQEREPWLFWSSLAFVESLAARWCGGEDLMRGYAQLVAKEAPDGEAVHALVPAVHIEGWLSIDDEERADEYFARDDVRDEIEAAAACSVDLPDFGITGIDCAARHLFLFAFCRTGDDLRARREFDAIGPRFQRSPWWYLSDEALGAFRSERERVSG